MGGAHTSGYNTDSQFQRFTQVPLRTLTQDLISRTIVAERSHRFVQSTLLT
jgi:hypothetical protein